VEALKERNGLLVYIHRPGLVAVNSHVSEQFHTEYHCQIRIDNSGSVDAFESEVVRQVYNRLVQEGHYQLSTP
jgi:hypothetical protein